MCHFRSQSACNQFYCQKERKLDSNLEIASKPPPDSTSSATMPCLTTALSTTLIHVTVLKVQASLKTSRNTQVAPFLQRVLIRFQDGKSY